MRKLQLLTESLARARSRAPVDPPLCQQVIDMLRPFLLLGHRPQRNATSPAVLSVRGTRFTDSSAPTC